MKREEEVLVILIQSDGGLKQVRGRVRLTKSNKDERMGVRGPTTQVPSSPVTSHRNY